MKVDYTRFSRAELIRTIEVLAERERRFLNLLAQAGVMPWQISDVKPALQGPPKEPARQRVRG